MLVAVSIDNNSRNTRKHTEGVLAGNISWDG